MTTIAGGGVDCADPVKVREFWREVLGYEHRYREDDWVSLQPPGGARPSLSFDTVPEG